MTKKTLDKFFKKVFRINSTPFFTKLSKSISIISLNHVPYLFFIQIVFILKCLNRLKKTYISMSPFKVQYKNQGSGMKST